MRTKVVQRLRIIYGIEGALSYASVLDIGRLWERLLHRAGMPLAYTQGFNPHPRLQFAAALAVGYTSSFELLDLLVSEPLAPEEVLGALHVQCPNGLTILRIEQIPLDSPSPQATLRGMSYEVSILTDANSEQIRHAISGLLAQTSCYYQRQRKGRIKEFDLRPLVRGISYLGEQVEQHILRMDLVFRAEGSIRPEEVISVLALPNLRLAVHRTALFWGEG